MLTLRELRRRRRETSGGPGGKFILETVESGDTTNGTPSLLNLIRDRLDLPNDVYVKFYGPSRRNMTLFGPDGAGNLRNHLF